MIDKKIYRHELPICDDPVVTSGLLGLQYSMFQAYHTDLTPILVNHYSNVSMNIDSRSMYAHIYDDNWLCNENVMHWHHMTWHKEMFIGKHDSLINILIKFISNNYYAFGHYNAYYIASEHACNHYNTQSHYLIYGYDLREKILLSIGYTKNNAFEKYQISFDEYVDSILNRTDDYFNWNFVKYNDNFDIKTDFKKVYNGIYDYINSKNKDAGLISNNSLIAPRYGIDCYKHFQNLLVTQHNFRKGIDLLGYKTLLEHHILMQIRIDYLLSCGALSNAMLSKEYKSICDLSKRIYEQCAEYNVAYSAAELGNICTDIEAIVASEQTVLNNVLDELKNYISVTK